MVYNIGDKVFAKGHKTNLWYRATITDASGTDFYTVKFDDGSVFEDLSVEHIAVRVLKYN